MPRRKYDVGQDDDGANCSMVPLSQYDLSLIERSIKKNQDTMDAAKAAPLEKIREAMRDLGMLDE